MSTSVPSSPVSPASIDYAIDRRDQPSIEDLPVRGVVDGSGPKLTQRGFDALVERTLSRPGVQEDPVKLSKANDVLEGLAELYGLDFVRQDSAVCRPTSVSPTEPPITFPRGPQPPTRLPVPTEDRVPLPFPKPNVAPSPSEDADVSYEPKVTFGKGKVEVDSGWLSDDLVVKGQVTIGDQKFNLEDRINHDDMLDTDNLDRERTAHFEVEHEGKIYKLEATVTWGLVDFGGDDFHVSDWKVASVEDA